MIFGMITLNQSIKIMQQCYIDTDSFIIHIKTEDFYEDIEDDVEKWFDTSNCDDDVDSPFPKGTNKKVIGLMKNELEGKIMIEFVALRLETHSYLTDCDKNVKKEKGTKKCVIERILKFNDYKDCLFKNEIVLKSQQIFKSEANNVNIEEINNIALSSNDDKRLQTFDQITTFPYGTNAFKVCDSEMLSKYK